MCSRQAKLPVGNFDAAAQPKPKSHGWPASGFSVLSPRDIYGTFCPGSICPGKAGRRRRMRRRWRQRTTQPCALQSYEEKRTFSQLIRHLRGRHKAEPARRREIKKRFWCLLGLRPKGTAARRRKHFVLSSGVLRDAQNIPSRDSAATVPLLKQHPCVSCGKLLRRIRAYQVCLPNRKRRAALSVACGTRPPEGGGSGISASPGPAA